MHKKIKVRKYITVVPFVLTLCLIWPLSVHAGRLMCPCYNPQFLHANTKAAARIGGGGNCAEIDLGFFLRKSIIIQTEVPSGSITRSVEFTWEEFGGIGDTFSCQVMITTDDHTPVVTRAYSCDLNESDCQLIDEECLDTLIDAAQALEEDPDINFNNNCTEPE